LTHRQILTVLSGLMLGMFLAALDQTIVATSITTIANDLQGLDQQAWATTAYLITSTIATPLYGKLSESVWAQAVLPGRDRDLCARFAGVHVLHLDVHAGRVPGVAGYRRRWVDVAGAGDHR
jgi:MFS family permease